MAANFPHKEALKIQLREAYGRIVYTFTTHLKKMNRLDKNNRRIKCAQIWLSAISACGFLGTMITDPFILTFIGGILTFIGGIFSTHIVPLSKQAIEFILTFIGGIFSTALLFLNLYFKDFNLIEESKQHRVASDNLWIIREKYISLLTDFDVLSEDDIMSKRDELQNLTFEAYNKSPKTDAKSYADAQKALKNEEEQFFTPEEIDKMLPAHLRITK